MKIKNKKGFNDKKDKKNNITISQDKKDKIVSDSIKSDSPSIVKLLKPNRNDSPIKKKEHSRVRKMVLELEKPKSSKSLNKSSKKPKNRKDSVDQNQSKITRFFGQNSE